MHTMFAAVAWLPLFLAPQEPDGLTVHVIDSVSRKPLVGAEVVCVRLGEPEELRWRPPISDVGYWERARASGISAHTDDDGRITFAGLEGSVFVSCSHEGLYAQHWILQTRPEIVELALVRDVELRVRTLDARGAPLERVGVGLVSRSIELPGARDSGFEVWFAIAESDTTGMARIPHAQRWLRDDLGMPLELRLALPCVDPPRVAIDPGEPFDARAFELVVPPTGSVRLLAPGIARGYARLRSAPSAGASNAAMWSHYAPLRAEIVDGVAEFAHVGAGVELEYEANWIGLNQQRRGRAPAISADSRTEIQLDGPKERSTLVGRLLDEELRPVTSKSFVVATTVKSGGSSRSTSAYSTTVEDGRFRVELAEPSLPQGQRRVLEFSRGAPPLFAYARFELTSGLRAGSNELGDLILCPAGSDARVRRMNDDELELEYARNIELLHLNGAWLRDVETCATEMSRRGGDRWVTFFRRQLETLRRDEEADAGSVLNSVSDFTLLMALRRAERKPDPAVLEIGPQSRLDTTLPELPRFFVRVRNVDPAESFTYSGFTYQRVRIEARAADGRVPPRRPKINLNGSWPAESGPLRPGASSTDGGFDRWIEVDLGEQLELGDAGEYEVRLFYSLDVEVAFEHDVRGSLCAFSEPVTIRVRAAAR